MPFRVRGISRDAERFGMRARLWSEQGHDSDQCIAQPEIPIGVQGPPAKRHAEDDIKEAHHSRPSNRVWKDVFPRMEAERSPCDRCNDDEYEKSGYVCEEGTGKAIDNDARP